MTMARIAAAALGMLGMGARAIPGGRPDNLGGRSSGNAHHIGRGKINPTHMEPKYAFLRRKRLFTPDELAEVEKRRADKDARRAEAYRRGLLNYQPMHAEPAPWVLDALMRISPPA